MRPANLPPPITDAEVRHALGYLQQFPRGLTRADLARLFGSDRRGRDIMAALAEQGIAAVITVDDPLGTGKLYRLARDESEVDAAARQLERYERSLRRRREGLHAAWRNGSRPRQAELFGIEAPA